ncbi:MAG: putative toxin-antitoxin system toxin component, PIN family [Mucilaginibacter sp.]
MKKTRYFIIDTNTLISAFILPASNARKALNKARKEGRILLSQETSKEFENVFIRSKFDKYLPLEIRLEIIDDFKSLTIEQNPTMIINDCRDPKDNKFLELAVSGAVDCIITGDQDLLVLNPYKQIPILTINQFLEGV